MKFDWVQFFFPYRRHLELELIQLRVDMSERLGEKDRRIASLEGELAMARGKCDRMELVLMPLSSRAGAAFAAQLNPPPAAPKVAMPPPEGSWQAYLKGEMAKMDALEVQVKEKTNGARSE